MICCIRPGCEKAGTIHVVSSIDARWHPSKPALYGGGSFCSVDCLRIYVASAPYDQLQTLERRP